MNSAAIASLVVVTHNTSASHLATPSQCGLWTPADAAVPYDLFKDSTATVAYAPTVGISLAGTGTEDLTVSTAVGFPEETFWLRYTTRGLVTLTYEFRVEVCGHETVSCSPTPIVMVKARDLGVSHREDARPFGTAATNFTLSPPTGNCSLYKEVKLWRDQACTSDPWASFDVIQQAPITNLSQPPVGPGFDFEFVMNRSSLGVWQFYIQAITKGGSTCGSSFPTVLPAGVPARWVVCQNVVALDNTPFSRVYLLNEGGGAMTEDVSNFFSPATADDCRHRRRALEVQVSPGVWQEFIWIEYLYPGSSLG